MGNFETKPPVLAEGLPPRVVELANKYPRFNEYTDFRTGISVKASEKTAIFDALATEVSLPLMYHTHKAVTDEILADISELIALVPESLDYRVASLRCRDDCAPIIYALVNNNIPMSVMGDIWNASPNAENLYYQLNNKRTHVFDDESLMEDLPENRVLYLRQLVGA